MRVKTLILAASFALAGLSGCSLGDEPTGPPQLGARSSDDDAVAKLGFPATATKNTIRVGGGDAVADAAGVASAVFPGTNDVGRPTAVVLVDEDDWQAGVTASVLSAAPIGAPLLISEGDELPPVTEDTLDRLNPIGSDLAQDAQVIRIGDEPPRPGGFKTAVIEGNDVYERAAAIDRFFSAAKGKPSADVVVVSGERSEYAMPAAAWAARSGDAVLLTRTDSVPAATKTALRAHRKPNIYLLGPEGVITPKVAKELGELGKVRRIEGEDPVANAIAFTRYSRTGFGWGLKLSGNNYTLANTSRPLDAAASAALATNGVFAPLLLTDEADELPERLVGYLQNVQPGYQDDPRQGAYNRVWILGDEKQLSVPAQARLDPLTELVPIENNAP
ncbi:MAG: cell wall-binding repeat-containing protein [Thermoleophilaceae bacterium]